MIEAFCKATGVGGPLIARSRSGWLTVLLVLFGLAPGTGAHAAQITYYLSGIIASGSLGAIPLFNTPAEFTVVSDDAYVTEVPGSAVGAPNDPPGSFFENADPLAVATVRIHLPDGTTRTATFAKGQIVVTEDLRNGGIGIGSNLLPGSPPPAGGFVYPFALASLSSRPTPALAATAAPLTGLPFVCGNFDPLSATPCDAVPLNTDLGVLTVNQQQGGNCYTQCQPARGVYAAVTNPTLFVDPGSPGGGTISATGATLNCPQTCSDVVSIGQDVLLTAAPAPG